MRWLPIASVFLLVVLTSPAKADPDLWGHVRFGLDMLQTHRLPGVDPYSFTQDRPWINHEWLSELQMGLAFAWGSTGGLVLLKAVLGAAVLAIVWSALGGIEPPARLMTVAVVILGTGRAGQTLRPQLWSLLCFAILSRVLTGTAGLKTGRSDETGRSALWLLLLFAVWANAHGGWLVGMGTLVIWATVDSALNPQRLRYWFGLVGAAAIGTLCTPYGWRLWQFLWSTVGFGRDITEWRPVWTTPPVAWVPWLLAAAASALAAAARFKGREPVFAVLAFLALASLRVERITPFFVLGAVLLLADELRRRWPERRSLSSKEQTAAGALCAIAASAILISRGPEITCIRVEGAWTPDPRATRLLDSAQQGRLVTFFNWGQYAIWHWGGRLRVSMDGRRETVYSDRRLSQHDAIVHGTAEGLTVLGEWRPEYVWLPLDRGGTKRWVTEHGYRVELDTGESFVAVRSDLSPLTNPVAGSPALRCFP